MGGDVNMPSIDVAPDGLRIDGVLVDAQSVRALTEVFGSPRILPPNGSTTWVVWDDVGVRVPTKDGEVATGVYVTVSADALREAKRNEPARRSRPAGIYPGVFTIGGQPPIAAAPDAELRKAYLMLQFRVGDWEVVLFLNTTELKELHAMEGRERFARAQTDELADMVRSAHSPVTEIIASYKPVPPVKKPSGKWKLPVLEEPTLSLKSFPFRLAILNELMFVQRVLGPRFNVYDFAQDRGAKNFDPDEYYDTMIPSVRAWLRGYPIPARVAGKVEQLVLDGGNEIYAQLIPRWDGEDSSFDITTITDHDLEPFTNLRRVEDIGGFLGVRARRALERRGVHVDGAD
ncbi:DUF6892 domain-containing protein [Pseudoclavibacter terrae]|uniref:Restriction endonuclease n=2 Tax=Pseudoclavibacter terrae TaxID=1530195 RepID=A0A7J5B628_9MICO|nr:hypothetical protein F8O03_04700 [Pseudoclavibacter terrae]